MKFKNLFGGKAAAEVNPAVQAMAQRVSTLEGCEALEKERSQQLEALPSGSRVARTLRKQIEELQRLEKGFAIAADRVRVAGVIKRDREDATNALKAAEAHLKIAADASTAAEETHLDRATIVAELAQELTELHGQADEAVKAAESTLREMIASSQNDANAEAAAFDALRKAQLHRATCGEALTFRLKGHEAEKARLEQAKAEAVQQVKASQDAVNLCRLQLSRVDYDQATQAFIDGYLAMKAFPRAKSDGAAFPVSTIQTPNVTFASTERAVWGTRLCRETGGLNDWVLTDIPRAMAPADLGLLTEVPAEETPEPDAPLPDPSQFIPGSMEFENAKYALEVRSIGLGQHEANQRAKKHPLTL